MKRIIKASLDDSKYYYLVTIGSGLAWLYLYVLEVDEPTTDGGYLIDELIDYLSEYIPDRLVDPYSDDAYALGTDENGNECLVEKSNPDEIAFYYDEFIVGGNDGNVLLHYGQFDIREISSEEAKKYIENKDAILIEV